jgi:hypothetical protein
MSAEHDKAHADLNASLLDVATGLENLGLAVDKAHDATLNSNKPVLEALGGVMHAIAGLKADFRAYQEHTDGRLKRLEGKA